MIEPILNYGKLRLLNVPGGKPVYDEVLVEDCYRRHTIPEGSIVIDVGGFYGEFGLWCAMEKRCRSFIFEPNAPSYTIAVLNAWLNQSHPPTELFEMGIGKLENSQRVFLSDKEHPAGSRFCMASETTGPTVICRALSDVIAVAARFNPAYKTISVKLDCEGAEREIFEDESWIDQVSWLAMEWHNKDGHHYRDILKRHGFTVELSEENPEVVRGTLWATKSK